LESNSILHLNATDIRHMVYIYNPNVGIFATLTQVSASVMPDIIRRAEVWYLFALHLMFCILYHHGILPDNDMMHLDASSMKVLSALTTFFEVFYTNECYDRYVDLYKMTRASFSTTFDFIFGLRAIMRQQHHQYTRLAGRYAMASTMLHFLQMNGVHPDEAWGHLFEQGFAKQEEREYLSHFALKEQCGILLHWSADVVYHGFVEARSPTAMTKDALQNLVEMATLQIRLHDTTSLPVPFQYFHLLTLMVCMNLVLWSFELAMDNHLFSPIVFFAMEVVYIGMLDIAVQLSNPFGTDSVDFDTHQWLLQSFRTTVALMEYPNTQEGWKKTLAQERPIHLEREISRWT
jgi:predicted membrane chloride channel (bestrophin family)